MIESADLGEALLGSALFSHLKEHEIDVVSGLVHEGGIEAGGYLFEESDPSDCLYIVRTGHLELEKHLAGGRRLPIARVGPGELLGEMGLVCNAPRSLAARAIEPVEYWRFRQTDFERLCTTQPAIGQGVAINIAVALSHRLVETNRGIAELYEKLDSGDEPLLAPLFAQVLARTFRERNEHPENE